MSLSSFVSELRDSEEPSLQGDVYFVFRLKADVSSITALKYDT